MTRILIGALGLGILAACTYVNEQPSRQVPAGYVQGAPYGTVYQAPRDSYETERQIYEQGRRDGARQGW